MAGAAFFDGLARDGVTRLPVPVNVGPRGQMRSDDELWVCFQGLSVEERRVRFGIPTVVDERATYDAMRLADGLVEAVVALDMMAAAERVSVRMMWEWAGSRWTAREPDVPAALRLASELSRSPNETMLRLIWLLLALLPRPLVNCPVYDREGRLLGIADLLDVVAGLVVEYDGAEHRRALRQAKDVAKEERLRRVGLEVTRVTGPDLHDPDLVVARLVSARSRARFEPESDRAWVARPSNPDLHDRIMARRGHEAWLDHVHGLPVADA